MKTVLVLSGGGVKGMMQATILNELEKNGKLGEVDLILGSSVGAINGSIYSIFKSASKLFDCYPDMAHLIFDKKKLFPPKYSRGNFIAAWNKIVERPIFFSDARIKLVITSVDTTHHKMCYFKSYKEEAMGMVMRDVVMRSFAAPYYFGEICDDYDKIKYGDGGMGEDNLPCAEAIAEAHALGWTNEEVRFIVIGCGFSGVSEDYNKQKKQGTIKEVMDYMSPSQGGMAREIARNWQLQYLEKNIKTFDKWSMEYYDHEIPKDLDTIDNIKALSEYINIGLDASKKPLISL